jgi:hypothetical protein
LQAPKSKTNPRHYAPGNHAPALLRQLPWRGHPHRCATLCGMASNNPVALCTHFVRPAHRTLEKLGTAEPSKGRRTTTPRPCRYNTVTPGRRDRSLPSPSALCDYPRRPRRHPGHCIAIPGVVEACGNGTPPRRLLYPRTASHQQHPPVLTRAITEQETATPPPSKPLLGAHGTRHDALPETRFARMAIYSATLYTMPLHVGEIVQHACKLPLPWSIKGGAVP